jgi:uncharacterized protein (DUF2126 family)
MGRTHFVSIDDFEAEWNTAADGPWNEN